VKWLILLLFVPFVIAANDPGHDTLYIEQVGDSNLTGSLNISDEFRVQNLWYSANLHLVGNGTILSAPSQPRLMGGSSQMYIDSTGNLYINTKGGTSSIVQIGDTATEAITLNVSGNTTFSHNVNVNEGNLLVAGTVRISNAGVGTFASGTTVNSLGICLADGTNCLGGGSASAGGWRNNSILVHLWSNSTNVSIGNTTGNLPILFVDTENERVGLGTKSPAQLLDVNGSIAIQGTTRISSTGVGTFAASTTVNSQNICLADGTNCPASGASFGSGWRNDSGSGNISMITTSANVSANTLFIDNTNSRVGIGVTSPTVALHVSQDLNVTRNIFYGGNISGYGADIAEFIHGPEDLLPGDVVVISTTNDIGVERSTRAFDTRVAGIVSSNPSHLLSADEGNVPLALTGRVPVKVTGEAGVIYRGDLLTTSTTPGHAMKCVNRISCTGAIVGKALEHFDGEKGMITALVVLG